MRLDLSQAEPVIDLRDPSLHLTESQASACNIQSEVMVTAGAGSGKTHTLSLRYVVLLLAIAVDAVRARPHDPRPDIQRVLVLTFTERAAQEMAQRCYERLLSLTNTCRQQTSELEAAFGSQIAKGLPLALSRLLDRFDEARVSTFHGFCATIHREFPSACNTPADARISEAEEAQRILELILSNALRDFGRESPNSMRDLIHAFGSRDQVMESAQTAIRMRSRLMDFLQDSAAGRLDSNTLIKRASLTPQDASHWLSHTGLPLLQQLQALLSPGGGAAFREQVLPALETATNGNTDPLSIYQHYTSVLSSVLTDKGTLRSLTHHSFVGTKASWPTNEQRVQALEGIGAISESFAQWPERYQAALALPTGADLAMLDALQALSELVLMTTERYDKELRDRGLIDFDALQRRAIDAVLSHSSVAQTLSNRHRYIMVDEFQDTDPAQWELVTRLGRPEGTPSDRLFLVGDAKQAIYGFRGGDVTVFQAAARELGVEPILFPENFRSRTELIDWFNSFFGSVLGPDTGERPDWEASHQELRPARNTTQGTVRLLTHEEPAGPAAARVEALGVAQFLRESVFSEDGILGCSSGTQTTNTPEVAILLRARTHLHLFEEALRLSHIPFQVGGGVGFWERPEIVDLVNTLHALATEDEVSAVGALRSPLFALSDDDVHAFYGSRRTSGLPILRNRPAEEGSPATTDARQAWTRLRADRHRLPWPLLLREILVSTHAAHAFELTGGPRAQANVQRLLGMADQLASNGLTGLTEAAELLLHNVQTGEREAEARVSNDAARVVVLTIHASKGLEFPLVILPGLEARPPGNTAPILCQRIEGQMEMACRVEDPHAALQTRVTPGSWHRLLAQRTLEESAERKRLFYVAATRARDHLVLVGGTSRSSAQGNTWMHQIAAHHGADFEGLSTRPLQCTVPTVPATPQIQPPPAPSLPSSTPPSSATARLSPSGMDQYRHCPARWYRNACMGIPEPLSGRREFPEAATLGSVLHALLEHSLVEPDADALRLWRVEASKAGANEEQIASGEAPLLEHLKVCRASKPLSNALAADGYCELGFSLKSHNLEISGVIDRLWWDEENQHWCVLDYKSGGESKPTAEDAFEPQHLTQLAAYAWAAEKILAGQNAGAVGPLQVCATATGELHEIGAWNPAAQQQFQSLLDSISVCSKSAWEDVLEDSRSTQSPRPCQQCGYYKQGCPGKA